MQLYWTSQPIFLYLSGKMAITVQNIEFITIRMHFFLWVTRSPMRKRACIKVVKWNFVCSPNGETCFYSRTSEQLVQPQVLLFGENNGWCPIPGENVLETFVVLRRACDIIVAMLVPKPRHLSWRRWYKGFVICLGWILITCSQIKARSPNARQNWNTEFLSFPKLTNASGQTGPALVGRPVWL